MSFLKNLVGAIPFIGPAILVGNMPTKEELADRWIKENLPNPNAYNATLATLTNDVTKWSNTCGDYIHQRNPLYNRANGRSICQSKIEKVFSNDLAELKNQELNEVNKLKLVGDNTQLYYLIALVVIVMIIIVLIIKS